VHSVSVVPGDGFEGRCVRSGPPSQLNLDENPEAETDEIVDVCQRLAEMTPELGTGRVESSELYIRAQTVVIELVGGRIAELILHPELPALGSVHDDIEASAFARVACAAPPAVKALIEYCEAEATALLKSNLGIVRALVDALIERGTLTGAEVDAVIERAVAEKALADERARRAAWKIVEKNAADFAAHGLEA
jgi:hypothetical protein